MKVLFLFCLIVLFERSFAVVVDDPLDVVVIGAGTAGIYSGRELERAGLVFKILEWSNRPFGRVHSIKIDDDAWFEGGAMWLQEVDRNTMVQDAEDLDIDTKKFDQGSTSVFTGGVLLTPEQVGVGVAKYYAIKANATQFVALGVSNEEAFRMAGYMGDDPLVELVIAFFDEQFFGDNTAYHDSTEWDYYASTKTDRIVLSGYDSLLDAVIKEAPSIENKIQYNSKVVAVDASNPQGGAVVTYKKRVPQPNDIVDYTTLSDEDASDGCNDDNTDDETKWVTHTVHAKEVICSAPLAVLRAGRIAFTPAMPAAMQHAVDHLLIGAVGKVALFFDDDGGRRALKKIPTNYMMRTSPVANPRVNDCLMVFLNGWKIWHQPVVVSYFQGDCARHYETVSDVDITAAHMVALREIFGGPTLNTQLPDPLKIKRTHWISRKNQGGVYTSKGLGSTDADLQSFKVAFGATGNIHIAGEHAGAPSNGYVHGAKNSGIYAAQNAIANI